MFNDGFHDRLLIFGLRPFCQILAPLATLIEFGARSQITPTEPQKQVPQHFQEIQKTVRAYTAYTLAAFKNLAIAEVSEVNLEFGVKVNVTSGIPLIGHLDTPFKNITS